MPLRSINRITISIIRSLIVLSTVVIFLQLLVHHEVGTRNLADTELIGVGDRKLAELLERRLAAVVVVVESFLLDVAQTAVCGIEVNHEETLGNHDHIIGAVVLTVACAKVLPGILVEGQPVIDAVHARAVRGMLH